MDVQEAVNVGTKERRNQLTVGDTYGRYLQGAKKNDIAGDFARLPGGISYI
jgi:hypothetical protein